MDKAIKTLIKATKVMVEVSLEAIRVMGEVNSVTNLISIKCKFG